MKATLLFDRREIFAPGSFAALKIWRVPQPIPGSAHYFKYSLAYVVNGMCVLRYDNERGKGDHRHVGAVELPYQFSSPAKLLDDFFADIEEWNDAHRSD